MIRPPGGPWSGFAAERTLSLAVLRGCLLDLLTTGDLDRVTAAMRRYLDRPGTGS